MIYDSFITEVAKSINGETSKVISHALVTTDTVSTFPATKVITGEIGDRFVLSSSRNGQRVTWDGIRTSSLVTSSDGDTLRGYASAFSSAVGSTNDFGWGAVLPNLVQTTAFDVNFVAEIRVRRA